MGKRAVKSTPPQRLDRAIDLLCSGARYGKVRDTLAEYFSITPRQAEIDIKKAYEALAQEEQAERPRRKTKLRAYLWRIVRKAESKGDYRDVISGCRLLAKIDGLEAPTEIIATQDAHPTEGMSSAEVRAYIRERQARREEILATAGDDSVH